MITDEDLEKKFEKFLSKRIPNILRDQINNIRIARVESVNLASRTASIILDNSTYHIPNVSFSSSIDYVAVGDVCAVMSTDPQFRGQNYIVAVFSNASSGTSKVADSSLGGWLSFTPTWTNLTVGTGGTNVGRYIQIGKTVHFYAYFLFGSGSSFGGAVSLTLPITISGNYGSTCPIGIVTCLDSGIASYIGYINTAGAIAYYGVTGTVILGLGVDATHPITFATNDGIRISGTYEAT